MYRIIVQVLKLYGERKFFLTAQYYCTGLETVQRGEVVWDVQYYCTGSETVQRGEVVWDVRYYCTGSETVQRGEVVWDVQYYCTDSETVQRGKIVWDVQYYCTGPETVRRGETVGIRCTIFNWIDDDVEVMLNLRKFLKMDYKKYLQLKILKLFLMIFFNSL